MNEGLLKRVLEISKTVFTEYGVKSVTMDDISRELGISKKTLYSVIKDKEDLIAKTSFSFSEQILERIDELVSRKLDPISELLEIDEMVSEIISSVHPSTIYQFQKYYPQIHKRLHDKQKSALLDMIKSNLKRGIDDGLYRSDMNLDFIASLKYESCYMISNQSLFSSEDFDLSKLKREYLIYHLRGIATYEGLSFIESKLREY
jgi:AcrR family transcriptional regulator